MTFFSCSKTAGVHIRSTDLPAVITPNCQDSTPDSSNPSQKLWMRLHRIGHRKTIGLFHPSHSVVGRLLSHMRDYKAVGSLIVPIWKSAYFWPLLCSDGMHLNFFVKDWLFLPNKPALFIKGKAKKKLFGTKAFKSRCLALRINFAHYSCRSLVGFCTSPYAFRSACRSRVP